MSAFYPFRGVGRPKRTLSAFFYRFSCMMASLRKNALICHRNAHVRSAFPLSLCFKFCEKSSKHSDWLEEFKWASTQLRYAAQGILRQLDAYKGFPVPPLWLRRRWEGFSLLTCQLILSENQTFFTQDAYKGFPVPPLWLRRRWKGFSLFSAFLGFSVGENVRGPCPPL